MGKYLLHRLLGIVPTVWFVGSAVFILLKLMPAEVSLLMEEGIGGNSSSRADFYKQYLERTGQHLPLFYVSLRSYEEPDTLSRFQPRHEQEFLRQLTLQYGNWPFVSQYHTHIKQFQKISSQTKEQSLRKFYQNQVAQLLSSTDSNKILSTLSSIGQSQPATSMDTSLIQAIQSLNNSFGELAQRQTPYKKYIPALSWHGSQNQYHQWLSKLIQGDLGISLRDARSVHRSLTEAIGNTLLLSICSLLLIFAIAILLNILITHPDNQRAGKFILTILYIIDTIPLFMLALLLLFFWASSQYLSLFPAFGLGEIPEEASWLEGITIRLYHLVIPIVCLTMGNLPYVTSQLYAAMREVTHADFIQTARAKGVAESVIIKKHILKNSLLPLITLFTGFIPALLGGAVVIEVIFAIPGTGQLLVDSVLARDYPVILGIVLLMALAKIVSHLIADILYYVADPRIRFS